MARRIKNGIQWQKVEHIRPTFESDKKIGLKLKETSEPFPRVTIITNLTDIFMFQFCLFSWKNLSYPKELLEWVIINNDKYDVKTEDDPRIRIITTSGKFNADIESIMEQKWSGETTESISRPRVYMLMECGDVMFPDTLSLKHRALTTSKNKECVLPDTLGYFDMFNNTSLVYKFFVKFPRNGLYWRKGWWTTKNSEKIISIPYIGNCITVGKPNIEAMPLQSSIRFFDNFPKDVRDIIKNMLYYARERDNEEEA